MANNRGDLYQLASDLKIDSDTLLSLVETAELLGFTIIAQGDATLTPLGETFAEASILARKEIFATRIRRLPFFKWLLQLLRTADRQRLSWDLVQAALEIQFPSEEAQKQLDIAVNWGRYAELLAYDDNESIFYLEPEGARTSP
jgi:NitT/TauT family transport system ATP-binding protein